MDEVRCEAASVDAMVQYLACNLIRHGYWHYFHGRIPAAKDPITIDRKLVHHYAANLDKFRRARRKARGLANVAYIRLGRDFLLVATDGEHDIFSEHRMRDFRRQHFRFHGYQIGAERGHDARYHASVRIGDDAIAELISHFESVAAHRSARHLADELASVRFAPYARVRRQLLRLLRTVNDRRTKAGYESLPFSSVRLRRRIVRVFRATPCRSP
jgi:hypothetical protein